MKKRALFVMVLLWASLVDANATHLDVNAPASAVAGVPISVTVTAREADNSVDGNYAGTVTLSSSDPLVVPVGYTFVSGAGGDNGQKTFSLTLLTAGNHTISASDGTIVGVSGTIVVSPASASTLTLLASSASVAPGGTASLTATLLDAYGNPIQGTSLSFSVLSGSGSVFPSSSPTNASGQASTTLTAGTISGPINVGVSLVSPALSASTLVTVLAGTHATLTLQASPTGVPAGGTSTITATLKDAFNNPVPNVAVTFSVVAGGGSIIPPSALTNLSGQASTVLTTNTIPGTNTVAAQVSSPALSGTTSVIGQDTSAPVIVHVPVTTAVASSPVTISAIVQDNVGVTSVALYFRATGTSIYSQVVMALTATPNTYQGTIPGSAVVSAGVDYYLKAEDAVPNTAYDGTSSSPHVISVASTDATPPLITHIPVTVSVANTAIPVTATVTDNVAVSSVKLYWRKSGTSIYTQIAMTASGSTFTASIPASGVTTSGVDYYIQATDAVPNTSSDGTSVAPHVIAVSASDTSAPAITHAAVTAAVAGNPVPISATVADNVTVSSVKLYWRKTGTTTYSNVAMSASGSTYSSTIPSSSVTTAGVDYYIEAKDAVPNTSLAPPIPPYTITVAGTDAIPPTIVHTSLTTGYSNTDLVISATMTDNVAIASAKLYYRTSGTSTYTQKTMTASGSTYTASIPASAVTTAGVDYYLEAKDATPNVTTHGTSSLPHQVLITGIPTTGSPPASLSPAGGVSTSDTTPTFSWQAVSGAVSYTVEYASTPTQVTVTTTSYTVPAPLATGSHYWKVRTNYSGGTSAWSPQQNYTISTSPPPTYAPIPGPVFPPVPVTPSPSSDKVAPTSTITAPPNGAKIRGSALLIKGTASDNTGVKKVEVSTDAGLTWQLASGTTSWSYSWRLPTDGIYVIKSRATDTYNNVEMLQPSVTVTLDNTSPQATIAVTEGQLVSGATFRLSGTASDASGIRKVEVSTDGGISWNEASGTSEWSYQWPLGADGKYTIKVRAIDTLGNEDIALSTYVITDNTPPVVTISLGEGQRMEKANFVTITGTAEDVNGISKVEVSVDGGQTWNMAIGTISWSYDMTFPAPGTYLIKARATDGAGNMGEATPKTITIAEKEKTFIERLLANWKLLTLIAGGIILGITVVLLIFYFRNR